MPYFPFDGRNIFYDTFGDGEPLLLLHGNTVSSAMFTSEIEFYTGLFKVIVFDAPGLGKSGRFERFRDDFWHYNSLAAESLLSLLEINRIKAIGTSGGAITGLNLAARKPSLVTKLIADSFFGLKIPVEEAEELSRNRSKAIDDLLTSAFWEAMNGDGWQSIVKNDYELLLRIAKNNLPIYYSPLADISAKVLFVGSREDELIPDIENRLSETALQITDCNCIFFDEGRHPFMITQKEKFRELALNFLID